MSKLKVEPSRIPPLGHSLTALVTVAMSSLLYNTRDLTISAYTIATLPSRIAAVRNRVEALEVSYFPRAFRMIAAPNFRSPVETAIRVIELAARIKNTPAGSMAPPAADPSAAKRNTPVAMRRHVVPMMRNVAVVPAVLQEAIAVQTALIVVATDTFAIRTAAAR